MAASWRQKAAMRYPLIFRSVVRTGPRVGRRLWGPSSLSKLDGLCVVTDLLVVVPPSVPASVTCCLEPIAQVLSEYKASATLALRAVSCELRCSCAMRKDDISYCRGSHTTSDSRAGGARGERRECFQYLSSLTARAVVFY